MVQERTTAVKALFHSCVCRSVSMAPGRLLNISEAQVAQTHMKSAIRRFESRP